MRLISKIEEARENIRYFVENLSEDSDMISNLSRFKHWFYDEEFDSFGPSKFVGYADNNFKKYFYGVHYLGTDGRESDDALAKFYKEVKNEEMSKEFLSKLEFFLAQYGKKPNKNAKIYVRK